MQMHMRRGTREWPRAFTLEARMIIAENSNVTIMPRSIKMLLSSNPFCMALIRKSVRITLTNTVIDPPPINLSSAPKLCSSLLDWASVACNLPIEIQPLRWSRPVFLLSVRKSSHARTWKRRETPWMREAGRVLTSGARVSHRGTIVFGLPSFHKFVLPIVRQLTPRFAQKRNENNDRADV